MNKSLYRTLSINLGGLLVLAGGLLFLLVADVSIHLGSFDLFLVIFTAIAGGILFLVAEYLKDRPIPFYILKGLGIVLSIGFIVYLFIFTATNVTFAKINAFPKFVIYFSLALSIISFLVQCFNIYIDVKYGADE